MIPRYALPEMAELFTDEARLATWLDVELLAVEAWAKLGVIPPADAEAIRQRASVAPAAVNKALPPFVAPDAFGAPPNRGNNTTVRLKRPPRSERRALDKTTTMATEASGRVRATAVTLEAVLRVQPQHTITPSIRIGMKTKFFACRAINHHHSLHFALLLRAAFGIGCASGNESAQSQNNKCAHDNLLRV